MKKIVLVAVAVGFGLAFLLAFSPNSMAVDNEASAVPYNGITLFETGGQPAGETEAEPAKAPYNGITVFEIGTGAAPEESSEQAEAPMPYNGITVF